MSLEAPTADPPNRPYLVCDGQIYAIGPRGLTIGRDRNCDVVLNDRQNFVSREHLRLGRDGAWVWAADLASKAGSQLRGEDLTRAERTAWLADGDVLDICGFQLHVFVQPGPGLPGGPDLRYLAHAIMRAGPSPDRDAVAQGFAEARGAAVASGTLANRLGQLASALGIPDEHRGTGRSTVMLGSLYQNLAARGRPVR